GKVLGVDNMSTADSAHVVQFSDNGTDDHLWQLVPNGDDWYRIRNRNSGKVLGVDNMSTADSAHVVQFSDNGTDDHLWQLLAP
ncbi:RICIN domain-containing protein, partial [Streptomyces sp. NPDC005078]